MEIREVTNEEYKKIVSTPFTGFEKAEFYALNSHKVDAVKYFIFNDGKDRFALVGGIKNNQLKFPFSASFECFSEITKNNHIAHYHNAVQALIKWAQNQNLCGITISLPPAYYALSHIAKFANALYVSDFKIHVMDLNFEYYLEDFKDTYEMDIDIKARQKLRKSQKNNLSFSKTDDIALMYHVIKQNRKEKGYPLWMTLNDVADTAKIIPSDFFIVKDANQNAVASALCHHITNDIVRVVYWGNAPQTEELCPMNFLSFNIFKYYKNNSDIKIIDIGPSTEDSVPNFGLCDFKESIGCKCSPKLTLIKQF